MKNLTCRNTQKNTHIGQLKNFYWLNRLVTRTNGGRGLMIFWTILGQLVQPFPQNITNENQRSLEKFHRIKKSLNSKDHNCAFAIVFFLSHSLSHDPSENTSPETNSDNIQKQAKEIALGHI